MASASTPVPRVVPVNDPGKGFTRKNYAERIQPYATEYYYYYKDADRDWKPRTPRTALPSPPGSYGDYKPSAALPSRSYGNYNKPSAANPHLVEVWEDSNKPEKILIHASRRAFVWVGNDLAQKQCWQMTVLGPLVAGMRARKQGQQVPLNALGVLQKAFVGGKKTGPGGGTPKPETTPTWATEENLIGYTCEGSIVWAIRNTGIVPDIVPILKDLKLTRLPSVYYKQGHLTADHKFQNNIGWRSEVGPCLFFGNVPEGYIDGSLLT